MAPVAVPTPDLGHLQQSLRHAGEAADGGAFADDVCVALRNCGGAANPHLHAVARGTLERPLHALADCAHFMSILHGQVPSLFELAGSHDLAGTTNWLRSAATAFNEDRRWLARLSVVTGGSIDLHGLTMAEQLVRDQRDALLTLAKSSRAGCALGAAVALVIDWEGLRSKLPQGAQALGFECRGLQADHWPVEGARDVLINAGDDRSLRRAITFGATQLASLHGQLFQLLEARHAARLS